MYYQECFYILVFHAKLLESGVYFAFSAHLSWDQPCFKCSMATCDEWLLSWTAQLWRALSHPGHVGETWMGWKSTEGILRGRNEAS